MKKTFTNSLFILLASSSISMAQSIPNADFELWNTSSVDTLESWKGTLGLKKVTGVSNSNAVRIETLDASDKASLIMGSISCISGCTGTVTGSGIPISADNVAFNLNFDYKTSGTGSPIVAMGFVNESGVMIGGTNWYYAASLTSAASFTNKSVNSMLNASFQSINKIPVGTKQVIIGFFPTLPISNPVVGAAIEVDNVKLTVGGTSVTIPNGDFEKWNTITTNLPQGWSNSENYLKGSVNKVSGVTGNAAEITTKTIAGFPSTGVLNLGSIAYDQSFNETGYFPVFKVNSTPTKLNFKYTYTPVEKDTASVYVVLTNKNKKVGSAFSYITSSANFTDFSLPLVMLNGETVADSAIVYFSSSRGMTSNIYKYDGSKLVIDNVAFEYPSSQGLEDNFNKAISISQNGKNVTLENILNETVQVTLVDLNGKTIVNATIEPNNKTQLNVSKSGIYIVHIITNEVVQSLKIAVE